MTFLTYTLVLRKLSKIAYRTLQKTLSLNLLLKLLKIYFLLLTRGTIRIECINTSLTRVMT
jgi:hypothetical protein